MTLFAHFPITLLYPNYRMAHDAGVKRMQARLSVPIRLDDLKPRWLRELQPHEKV